VQLLGRPVFIKTKNNVEAALAIEKHTNICRPFMDYFVLLLKHMRKEL